MAQQSEQAVQEYLDTHKLQQTVEEAINACVKANAEDPCDFIGTYLSNKRVKKEAPTSGKPTLITIDVGNNPSRVRMLVYYKGLEDHIDMKTPADYGGMASADFRAINPEGKVPVLVLEGGEVIFEARVICNYLADRYAGVGPSVQAVTAEERARAELIHQASAHILHRNMIVPHVHARMHALCCRPRHAHVRFMSILSSCVHTQIHDLYIASPNSSDPSVIANQGVCYKPTDVVDGPSRAAKVAELYKQIGVLESLVVGPYVAGETLTVADLALYPTLGVFLDFLVPKVFGWKALLDPATKPKLIAWCERMESLPAAVKVKAEMLTPLQGWEDSGRLQKVIDQTKEHPTLKWIYP